jgi:hypothetical protein
MCKLWFRKLIGGIIKSKLNKQVNGNHWKLSSLKFRDLIKELTMLFASIWIVIIYIKNSVT